MSTIGDLSKADSAVGDETSFRSPTALLSMKSEHQGRLRSPSPSAPASAHTSPDISLEASRASHSLQETEAEYNQVPEPKRRRRPARRERSLQQTLGSTPVPSALERHSASSSSYASSASSSPYLTSDSYPSSTSGSSRLHSPSHTHARTIRSLNSLTSIKRDLPEPRQATNIPESSRTTMTGRRRRSASSRGSSPRPPSSRRSSASPPRRVEVDGFDSDDDRKSQSPLDTSDLRFELVIRQQPGRAAAAGLSPAALSRLPVVPSPIVQLRVTDRTGDEVPHTHVLQSLPYLVCSCVLLSAADDPSSRRSSTIEYASQLPSPSGPAASSSHQPSGSGHPLPMLCGTRVYSAIEAVDLDGQSGLFFIFWDVSVRQEGEYRMQFSLIEALPGSPTLASATSLPFEVVQMSDFPGNTEIATELSRHFQRQGIRVYLPPFGISTRRSES